MKTRLLATTAVTLTLLCVASIVSAEEYQLVTGVGAATSPGAGRPVFSSGGFPAPGTFIDGQRLGGTPSATPTSYLGTGTPLFQANEFGALSFMFRRGSIPAGAPGNQMPLMSVDYLGGPLLDLDGDANNGTRSLVPIDGQSATAIPGTTSTMGLSFDTTGGTVSLNSFDATATNEGASVSQPDQVISVNTLAGTTPTGMPGNAINPSIDTRVGSLFDVAPGITGISNLGFELWQDSIDATSSSAAQLGTIQFLGTLNGWKIERGDNGEFPTLTGLLGTTPWAAIDDTHVGQSFASAVPLAGPTATITDGVTGDTYGPGGIPLTDYADLGVYLDAVVIPAIDPMSESFVYLESVGFGINNSFDPIFQDTVGYDVVLIAQSAPVPEPASIGLLFLGSVLLLRRRSLS